MRQITDFKGHKYNRNIGMGKEEINEKIYIHNKFKNKMG